MGHEITKTDGLVLDEEGGVAWHGLGLLIKNKTPTQVLEPAGMNWTVVQRPLICRLPVGQVIIDTHYANFRSDNDQFLAVVTEDYRPINNIDMAEFCEALTDVEGSVKVETAGSIRGGKRVWFLLKGEAFQVARGDQIFPYILVSNAHDGTASFRVTPTTVRVVCSNTLHMVLPRYDNHTLGDSALAVRHTGNVKERVDEVKRALAHFGRAQEETRELMEVLAAKDIDSDRLKEFFMDSYVSDFGAVPANPKNRVEENQVKRAVSAFGLFSRRFDDKQPVARSSWWNAVNAYSGLIQHDRKARGVDDTDRVEKRADSNMFGLGQKRTQAALQRAFQMSAVSA